MTNTQFAPLELTKTANGKTAVQCSTLYKALGLADNQYLRWVSKNILNNVFAENGTDYTPLNSLNVSLSPTPNPLTRPNGEISQTLRQRRNRNRQKDFVLTLDFAKKLAMQARTEKGETVRNYFLYCEKVAKAKTEMLNAKLMAELEAYRELEAIREQRRILNAKARQHRERIKQARQTIEQIKYIQLQFNF